MHINQIIRKANNVLGTTKRNFNSRDPIVIRSLYTTLIRSILDYASTIWNPHHLGNIRKLEKILRRATKLIPTLQNLPYSDRLQSLNLPSLPYHRNRMDLVMTHKILNGAVLVDKEYLFTMNTSYSTRSNGYKIYKKFNRTALRRFTFFRIINNWNSLPHEIVTSPNVLSFIRFSFVFSTFFICMIYWDWFCKTLVFFFD